MLESSSPLSFIAKKCSTQHIFQDRKTVQLEDYIDQMPFTALTATAILAVPSRVILCQGLYMGYSYIYTVMP
jgi:hypothetical protein